MRASDRELSNVGMLCGLGPESDCNHFWANQFGANHFGAMYVLDSGTWSIFGAFEMETVEFSQRGQVQI